jgi:hypothetical protein
MTPSGILVITFYSNIRLGRNWRRWKAKKNFCNLSAQKAINSVQTALQKIPELLSGQEKLGPSGRPKAPVLTCVPQTPFLTQNRVF